MFTPATRQIADVDVVYQLTFSAKLSRAAESAGVTLEPLSQAKIIGKTVELRSQSWTFAVKVPPDVASVEVPFEATLNALRHDKVVGDSIQIPVPLKIVGLKRLTNNPASSGFIKRATEILTLIGVPFSWFIALVTTFIAVLTNWEKIKKFLRKRPVHQVKR